MDASKHNSEIYAAVFGKGGDFVIVPLPANERPNPPLEYAAKNGLPFCGVMALIDGKCHARCQPGEDAVSTMMSAAPAVALYIRARVPRPELLKTFQPLKWSELS